MRKAPINMPGKKPARKTPTGNLLHFDVGETAELRPVEVDVAVAEVEAVEDLDEVDVVDEDVVTLVLLVLAIRLQTFLPSGDRIHS